MGNIATKAWRQLKADPVAALKKVALRPVRCRLLDDKLALRIKYRVLMGSCLDLDNPTGFNEKLQWLKLHDHNPLYTTLVDKCAVKDWVADRIGAECVTKTLAVWNSVEDIDISVLPDKFVLKTNHDSGGVVICRNKSTFDLASAKKKLAASMKRNYFYVGREWPYKNVKPCIFAEEYIESVNSTGDLPDYKLFRFSNGRIVTLVCEDRFSELGLRQTFFDEDWHPLPLCEGGHDVNSEASRPEHFVDMLNAANKLAEHMPFARVDFYESGNQMYFGEITFYPNSGFEQFDPKEWDARFGSWIALPEIPGGGLLMSDKWLIFVRPDSDWRAPQGTVDYKFYCFDGEPRFLYVSQGLEDHETASISFLDLDWRRMPFKRDDYRDFAVLPNRPESLDEMSELSRVLSKNIPFVRVDFFEHDAKPRFSEMTFHPCSGFMKFDPPEWDGKVGDMLRLEGVKRE